jgi:hypothetical protein
MFWEFWSAEAAFFFALLGHTLLFLGQLQGKALHRVASSLGMCSRFFMDARDTDL